MTSTEIRESFLKFFEQRGHRIVPSAQVIPHGDPTLLFTNAGMNQFKDVFLGTGKREYVRAADTQKCIRVSGKHNDLEEVGRDTYHHTFFEMLGNWSFGDYYKKEAIEWAWELLTKVWGLDKKRLYATVFETDTEAADLWKKVTDIDPTHVLPFGKKDNFWEMGETGPCGPCSEIHIDRSEDNNCGHLVNKGDARVMEIWNLVFIQNNRNEKGELEPLPAKHVDTGMGFERICAVMQNKSSNYDTDVFMPIISAISRLTDKEYSGTIPGAQRGIGTEFDTAMRVIADHVRMLTFAIADGAVFANNDRGSVMKRILNRASRFGRALNMDDPFIYQIVDAVVDSMGATFPELVEKRSYIRHIIQAEEERFSKSQKDGFEYLYRNVIGEPIRQAFIQEGKITKFWYVDSLITDGNTLMFIPPSIIPDRDVTVDIRKELERLHISSISGEDAFTLHDTYGIHIDTTETLAKEVGLSVNRNRYEELMGERKASSKSSRRKVVPKILDTLVKGVNVANSTFVGYSSLETDALIIAYGEAYVVLDKTPFYAESGGQIGDTGLLAGPGLSLRVVDTQRDGKIIAHRIEGTVDDHIKIHAVVDSGRRRSIQRNHSATHLIHEALRRVLGAHVQQQGSLVDPKHLRFDFPHFGKIIPEDLQAIEAMVNAKIAENIEVISLNDQKDWVTIEEAKRRYPNIKMLFGEKYSDHVRIVEIDPQFSVELCGGTHVKNTKDIGLFKIVSESSIASGVRRIEAVTGEGVQHYIDKQLEKAKHIDDQLAKLIEEKEMFERELNRYTGKTASSPRPNLGAISLSSSQAESIKVLEATLVEREQAVEHVSKQTTDLKKELSKYKVKEASSGIDSLIAMATPVNGFKVVSSKIEAATMDELKNIGDTLRSKLGSGVGVLASIIDEKVALVCVVTDDLIKQRNLQAGKIVGEMAKQVGGGGGGKPHLATAGGKDVAKLDDALHNVSAIVQTMLSK